MDPVKRRHPLSKCEDCDLFNDDSIFVPSSAPKEAPQLVIVGEAPGVQEARSGIPFVGPSGKLLDTVLRGHGLRRQATYITNVCLCRPRNNATPSSRAVAACADRLTHELSQATKAGAVPIVALGNTAASAVFGTKIGITTFRVGPPKESHLYPGVKIIPTVHPAYVLRAPSAFPMFSEDIGKINSNITINWEPPTYRVFEDSYDARQALHQLEARKGDVVVDIEIGSEKDEAFVHPDQYRLLCIGFAYAPGRAIVIGKGALRGGGHNSMDPVLFSLGRVLGNRNARVVAHNGKFDLAGLRFITKARLGFDTMLASYAVDERPGVHGLKYLAQEKLGYPNYAVEIHKYLKRKGDNFAHIPREVLYKYNAFDVCSTYDLKDYYEGQMSEDEKRVEAMLTRASGTLMNAEMRGIRVDTEYLEKLSDQLDSELLDLQDYLSPWVDNPRSWMQVRDALAKLGVRVSSTNVATLNLALRHPGIPEKAEHFIHLLLEHRKAAKLYGTYVKGIFGRLYNGRVHPTFLLHGTTTGRLACRNPNLQNQPRDPKLRRMYIPDPGKTFVQGDYKGVELRVVCCEAKDVYLRQLFLDGRDIHNEVATRFFGPGFTKDQRVRAKAVVFGLAYGREAYSLAQEYNIPVTAAQKYIDTFFEMIPDTVRWQKETEANILHGEDDLVTHFGRHRRIWLVTEENKKDIVKEGIAFKPQSTASDITLHAAMELHEKYKLDIRLLVHDSILVETDQPEEVAQLMREVMPRVAQEVYSDYVPFEADVKIGTDWSQV